MLSLLELFCNSSILANILSISSSSIVSFFSSFFFPNISEIFLSFLYNDFFVSGSSFSIISLSNDDISSIGFKLTSSLLISFSSSFTSITESFFVKSFKSISFTSGSTSIVLITGSFSTLTSTGSDFGSST